MLERMTLPFELKEAETEGDLGIIKGYAGVKHNVDGGGDVIMDGAFRAGFEAMARERLTMKMYAEHRIPIGLFPVAREDKKGLWVEGSVVMDTQAGHDAFHLAKNDVYDAMSIGYKILPGGYNYATRGRGKNEVEVRELSKIMVVESSLVPFGMNSRARVATVKAAQERFQTIRELETFLRDEGGFSRAAAKAVASGGFKSLIECRDDTTVQGNEEEDAQGILHTLRNVGVFQ